MCSNPRQSQSDALVDRRVPVADVSNVALEMANIEWVEPNLGITYGFFWDREKKNSLITYNDTPKA